MVDLSFKAVSDLRVGWKAFKSSDAYLVGVVHIDLNLEWLLFLSLDQNQYKI